MGRVAGIVAAPLRAGVKAASVRSESLSCEYPLPTLNMTQQEPDPQATNSTLSDRRRASREALDVRVQVTLDTHDLKGTANNVSKSGILFFTDGELRVTVQMEENGAMREMTGSLVRCERIKDNHRGWAVEFDE